MGNKKKMTVLDFQKYKDEGRKFSFVTAYDYTTASIVNESDCEIILVGDSLGMIMLGYNTTVPVTVDDMIHTSAGGQGRSGHLHHRRYAVWLLQRQQGAGH